MEHRSKHPEAPALCGFYWHSTRMTRVGTDLIYNQLQSDFQSLAEGGKVDWTNCKEMLFKLKKEIDQKYRNMMWHFSQGGACERCKYWDDMYRAYQAQVETDSQAPSVVPSTEISDVEMLSAVESMEVDGAN